MSLFPTIPGKRPFFLELLGLLLLLAGGGVIAGAFLVPRGDRGTLAALAEGLWGIVALAVVFALWKGRARPALLGLCALFLIKEWIEAGLKASLVGSAAGLAVLAGFLYLWPSTVHYYRRLREPLISAENP